MRARPIVPILLLIVAAGCGDSAGPNGNSAVTVQDDTFNPNANTVATGATVTWTWAGSNPHDVTWVAGAPPASATQTAGTYQRTFGAAGAYEYYCTVHGTPTTGMRGAITVQ